MALKRLKTKKSKRLPANQKYKILKKIKEHQRKVRKENKKHPKKSQKQKLIQVPNICPFKEEILKDASEFKKRQEEEKVRRHEILKKAKENKFKNLENIVEDAQIRGQMHEILNTNDANEGKQYNSDVTKGNSLKAYFKEFKKVVENADVVLEVVDARDPIGTRCSEVESTVKSASGNKRLVLILNKADLISSDNLKKWIKYFRKFGPVTAFKASTQDQNSKLGRRKFSQISSEKALTGGVCVGAELLMNMLGNYCRNKGVKSAIRVGVVGIPNVGKSSIINSLKRGKVCSVGCTPGITKVMQEIELDSKIKLFDCPGIVFSAKQANGSYIAPVLKNAQRVGDVKDPFTIAESILKRASKEYFCKLYDITEYESYEEFFAKKAARMGKFLKKGVPDVTAAARSVLNDWNIGKIKYCSEPPENNEESVHISASIVNETVKDFEVENFESMQKDIFSMCHDDTDDWLQIKDSEPLESNQVIKSCSDSKIILEEPTLKKSKNDYFVKEDPTMLVEGNQSINRLIKSDLKKRKKIQTRNDKKMNKVSDILENFTLSTKEENYNFDTDYNIK